MFNISSEDCWSKARLVSVAKVVVLLLCVVTFYILAGVSKGLGYKMLGVTLTDRE